MKMKKIFKGVALLSFILFFLVFFLAMVLWMVESVFPGSVIVSEEEQQHQNQFYQLPIEARNILRGGIQYIYDAKTDICYAIFVRRFSAHDNGLGMTVVSYEKVKDYAVVINEDEPSQKRDP